MSGYETGKGTEESGSIFGKRLTGSEANPASCPTGFVRVPPDVSQEAKCCPETQGRPALFNNDFLAPKLQSLGEQHDG